MALDRNLRLVMPVDTVSHGEVTVTSTPFSAAFFRQNFMVIAKTFARLHAEGMGIHTAPRVAALMLEQVERDLLMVPDDAPPPPSPVMNEIRRMTQANITGHGDIPWQSVIEGRLLDEDDIAEVENVIVFFMVASSMYHRRDAEEMIGGAAKLWNARLESSNTTASSSSSPTLKEVASSGATETPSPIPR